VPNTPKRSHSPFSLTLPQKLAKTFGDFEIILGDNVATDRTQQICPRGSN
jgi:hypothetical protein